MNKAGFLNRFVDESIPAHSVALCQTSKPPGSHNEIWHMLIAPEMGGAQNSLQVLGDEYSCKKSSNLLVPEIGLTMRNWKFEIWPWAL